MSRGAGRFRQVEQEAHAYPHGDEVARGGRVVRVAPRKATPKSVFSCGRRSAENKPSAAVLSARSGLKSRVPAGAAKRIASLSEAPVPNLSRSAPEILTVLPKSTAVASLVAESCVSNWEMATWKEPLAVLPQESVAVQLTVVVPTGKRLPNTGEQTWEIGLPK